MDLQCLTTACRIFLHVGDLYICIFNKKILWDAVCLQSIRHWYCTAYAIIGGVNPGSAAYNLGNMKPVQLESLFSKKIGCPFWKMKPSTSGLPCIEVLVWLSVLENETQFSSKGLRRDDICVKSEQIILALASAVGTLASAGGWRSRRRSKLDSHMFDSWASILENETQYNWTPMYRSLGLVVRFGKWNPVQLDSH